MTKRRCDWRIRLAFEPNRFSSEQLAKVYEQLKPTDSRATPTESLRKPAKAKRPATKRGEQ